MALSVTVHGFTIKTGAQTTGRQATAELTAPTGLDTVVYTLPETPGLKYAVLAVSVCNKDVNSADTVSVAVSDSVVPKAYDWIEWNTTLVPRGVLERTQLTVSPGQSIVVRWGTPPAELITESEMLTTVSYSFSATGTGTVDINTPDIVSYTLAEGDTGDLQTDQFTLVDGATYRAAISFNSTEVTGTSSAITMDLWDGLTAENIITLGIEDRNKIDTYRTYTAEFTVDNAGAITDQFNYLRVNLADVNATIDRISLIQIAGPETVTNGDFANFLVGWIANNTTLSNDTAVMTTNANLEQLIDTSGFGITDGTIVQVSFDIVSTDSNTLTYAVDDGNLIYDYIPTTDITGQTGTITDTFTYNSAAAGGPNYAIRFATTTPGTTIIDNVSIRPLYR
jgi:hypothetical protein